LIKIIIFFKFAKPVEDSYVFFLSSIMGSRTEAALLASLLVVFGVPL